MKIVRIFFSISALLLVIFSTGCGTGNLSGKVAYTPSECELHNGSCYNNSCPEGYVEIDYTCVSEPEPTTTTIASGPKDYVQPMKEPTMEAVRDVTGNVVSETIQVCCISLEDMSSFTSSSTSSSSSSSSSSSTSLSETTTTIANITTTTLAENLEIYSTDFESGEREWSTGGVWELGEPSTTDPDKNGSCTSSCGEGLICSIECHGNGGPDSAYSGEDCWGTDLDDYYPNDQEFYLLSPSFDFSAYENINLAFYEWLEVELSGEDAENETPPSYDSSYLQYRVGSGEWKELRALETGPAREDDRWYYYSHDISSEVAGQSAVQFRWLMKTDEWWQWAGWYVDNFALTSFLEDTKAPNIENVQVIDKDTTSAKISWRTDELSKTKLSYGTDKASLQTVADPDYATEHQVTLTGLEAGVKYYYSISSEDSKGNAFTDDNSGSYYYFTTLLVEDTVPPQISSIKVSNVYADSAKIRWQTDEPATSTVYFGKSLSYDSSKSNSDLAVSHSIKLTGLSPLTRYYFEVISEDSKGNTASHSANFSTNNVSESSGEDTSGDDMDIEQDSSDGAVISDVKVITISHDNAKITWETTLDSSSLVRYGTTTGLGTTVKDDTAVSEHEIMIEGLDEFTKYYFRVQSKDVSGNLYIDDNDGALYTFTTTKKPIDESPQEAATTTTTIPEPLQTCGEKQGYICTPEEEFCPGSQLLVSDTEYCCDEECAPVVCSTAEDCGEGLFNLCDRDECSSCLEGAYFNEYIVFGMKFRAGDCNACTEDTTCEDYKYDLITCEMDPCDLGSCGWGRFACESK